METLFVNTQSFDSDFYVADYTESSKTHPEHVGRKVEITGERPDIAGLWFWNPRHVQCHAVNFEKNSGVFEVDGKKVSQCECCGFAHGSSPWLAFVEMKYCQEKNCLSNAHDALVQVESTYKYLSENYESNLKSRKYRIYFIVSLPEHDNHSPFLITQDDKLRLREKNVILIDSNKVEIRTASHLFQR